MKNRWLWKSRWAAAGAAIAVSIGGGGIFLVSAASGPLESTVVPVSPTRVLDTRDPSNLGLPGPFVSPVSQKLQITGAIPTAAGVATVVPRGATGVLLNVTSVNPSANGFFVGDTTASQQICGATVTYTVPTGFSVLNAAPDPEPVERSQGGIPEEIPANSPAGGG